MKKVEEITSNMSSKIRLYSSQWIGTVALALFIFSIFLFAWMWLRAYQTGAIPDTEWGINKGNHGPWRYRRDLSEAWTQFLDIQIWAFILSYLSIIFKRNIKAAIIFMISFLTGFGFLVTHYWLVD